MPKKKKKVVCEEMAPWMITFSDVMTLMLTFFVLLVSMSKIDERRKLVVLGSIIGAFGWDTSYDPMSVDNTKRTVEPGVMDNIDDLMSLKPMLWEDIDKDLDFESNRFVQVLHISAEVLFTPGSTTLSAQGMELLDRMVPVLSQIDYPLLIAGHTASIRDELGEQYRAGDGDRMPDLSWKIALNRALAVYTYFIDSGISPDKLRVQSYGRFAPHYNNSNPKERMRNRRVDIVLDKRSLNFAQRVEEAVGPVEVRDDSYEVDGFRFQLEEPADERIPVTEPVPPEPEPAPQPGQ